MKGKGKGEHYPEEKGGGNKGVAPKTVLARDEGCDGGGNDETVRAAKGIYDKSFGGKGGGDPAMRTR
jgi:hypothetical protein